MNKFNILPLANSKRPEILDSYPDIDYEMIPIQEDQNQFIGHTSHFHIDQSSTTTMKNMMKSADHFKIVKKFNALKNPILHISNKNKSGHNTFSSASIATVLVPLNQVKECKRTKNYTKLYLTNGQVF